jgi:hypothetical protein
VSPVLEEDFSNLSRWSHFGNGTVAVSGGVLHWNALPPSSRVIGWGNLWYTTSLSGPIIVEYEVKSLAGEHNLNLFMYSSALLSDREAHTTGSNYMINYVDPENDGTYRLRLRKNPGRVLLKENLSADAPPPDTFQKLVYVFASDGRKRIFVNGHLVLEHTETSYTSGYLALRNFQTHSQYRNVKLFSIMGPL